MRNKEQRCGLVYGDSICWEKQKMMSKKGRFGGCLELKRCNPQTRGWWGTGAPGGSKILMQVTLALLRHRNPYWQSKRRQHLLNYSIQLLLLSAICLIRITYPEFCLTSNLGTKIMLDIT